jgi:hypothetical protein
MVDNKKEIRTVEEYDVYTIPIEASDIKVNLGIDYRQKGLLWYSTYKVDFISAFSITNDTGQDRYIDVTFPFPARNAIYDDFSFTPRNMTWANKPSPQDGRVIGKLHLTAGQTVIIDVSYHSQGLDNWNYQFGRDVSQVKNFKLVMQTDFKNIDFPEDSIAPSSKEQIPEGWKLSWQFNNLVTGVNIGMSLPQKLQPGPLAGEISFFAPVSLFFFIVVMLVITLVKRIDMHPMHFFFLSATFFAFHLLLAYLVDHISIHLAFAIAAVVSLGLTISYLRIIFGSKFAFSSAGMAQLIYLILFSYAFFFKGLTGLAVTVGAILTLFVMMQITAKINWTEIFKKN